MDWPAGEQVLVSSLTRAWCLVAAAAAAAVHEADICNLFERVMCKFYEYFTDCCISAESMFLFFARVNFACNATSTCIREGVCTLFVLCHVGSISRTVWFVAGHHVAVSTVGVVVQFEDIEVKLVDWQLIHGGRIPIVIPCYPLNETELGPIVSQYLRRCRFSAHFVR
jgi:hypothetical protein